MYEVGRAGSYVSGQRWRRLGTGALYTAGAVAGGAACLGGVAGAVLTSTPPLRVGAVVLALGSAGLTAWLVRQARAAFTRARQAAIGATSEREVRRAVRRTASIAAAYGLMLGDRGGDCDVVVFTRTGGAAAIEVKTGHGAVWVERGALMVGRRALRKNPAGQAAHQARRLSGRLNRRAVLAVVCIPGMTNRPFTTDNGVWVCGAGDLTQVLDRAPKVFTSIADAEDTMRRLWAAAPA